MNDQSKHTVTISFSLPQKFSSPQVWTKITSSKHRSLYTLFKRTVHPGNSENKQLPLDPYHLMALSIVSAFVCSLPVRKSPMERQGSSRQGAELV